MRLIQIIKEQEEGNENNAGTVKDFFDKEETDMDINEMKPTDLSFNNKVFMIKAIGQEKKKQPFKN